MRLIGDYIIKLRIKYFLNKSICFKYHYQKINNGKLTFSKRGKPPQHVYIFCSVRAFQEHFTSIILPLEDIDPSILWGWFLKLEDCIQNAINNLQTSCCSLNRPQNMTCPAFKTLSPSIKFREEGVDFVNWHNSFNETLIFSKKLFKLRKK